MIIIFDIDLTICDNFQRKKLAFERALGRKLLDSEDDILRNSMAEKVLRHLEVDNEIGRKILKHFFYDMDLYELDVPMSGAVETLKTLAEAHKIYYVTGRPIHSTAVDFLKRNDFPRGEVFAEFVAPGESRKKIKLFNQILEKENTSFAVAVGDLPGDALAAKEAGLYAVGTVQAPEKSRIRDTLEKVCDVMIEDIRELLKLVEELEEKEI